MSEYTLPDKGIQHKDLHPVILVGADSLGLPRYNPIQVDAATGGIITTTAPAPVIVTTNYVAINAGVGYAVNDLVRQTQLFNVATGALVNTIWYNITTGLVIAVAPLAPDLQKLGNAFSFEFQRYMMDKAGTGYAAYDIVVKTVLADGIGFSVRWDNITSGVSNINPPLSADLTVYSESGDTYVAKGYENITQVLANTAMPLTIPAGTLMAIVSVESGAIRVRQDATVPTGITNGQLFAGGGTWFASTGKSLADLRILSIAGATIGVEYLG